MACFRCELLRRSIPSTSSVVGAGARRTGLAQKRHHMQADAITCNCQRNLSPLQQQPSVATKKFYSKKFSVANAGHHYCAQATNGLKLVCGQPKLGGRYRK